jgi:hypothetical protein
MNQPYIKKTFYRSLMTGMLVISAYTAKTCTMEPADVLATIEQNSATLRRQASRIAMLEAAVAAVKRVRPTESAEALNKQHKADIEELQERTRNETAQEEEKVFVNELIKRNRPTIEHADKQLARLSKKANRIQSAIGHTTQRQAAIRQAHNICNINNVTHNKS